MLIIASHVTVDPDGCNEKLSAFADLYIAEPKRIGDDGRMRLRTCCRMIRTCV
ncbi:MAG: hypothetical protein ACR2HP_15635 [Ilumatobacteraceae bacterium]